MSKYINKLEFAILQDILKSSLEKESTLYILKHLPFLEVKNREITGVGMYINFQYADDSNIVIDERLNLSLSSPKTIKFNTFNEYFSFELDVSNGKINYLEIVTYKTGWNGLYDTFVLDE